MATRLEQAAEELKAQVGTQTSQAKAPTAPTAPKKPAWTPRWVAVRNADGTFARFGELTLTAPRNQVRLGEDLKLASVNVMSGDTRIATVDVSADSTAWSIKTAATEIREKLGYMSPVIKVEPVKDGSADVLAVRFGENIVLRVFIGGINNSVIPSAVANQYGLVVCHAQELLGGWVKDNLLTSDFNEALSWVQAKCPTVEAESDSDNGDAPF